MTHLPGQFLIEGILDTLNDHPATSITDIIDPANFQYPASLHNGLAPLTQNLSQNRQCSHGPKVLDM